MNWLMERRMSRITALAGRAELLDPSEEETVINAAPYRAGLSPNGAADLEVAKERPGGRRADELRRRALASARAH